MYILDSGECWLLSGSLNYDTTLQLELFCPRSGKWDDIPYVQMFMSFHNLEAGKEGNKLMFQRQTASVPEPAAVPIPDSRPGELKGEEELNVLVAENQYPGPATRPPLPDMSEIDGVD